MTDERHPLFSNFAVKAAIVGAVGFGALATGMFFSRRGRRLVQEAWQGRERTRLEDRVLDTLWGDPVFGRRRFEVEEVGDGTIALSGPVRTRGERRRVVEMVRQIRGVTEVVDHLELVPGPKVPPSHMAELIDRARSGLRNSARNGG